MKSSQPAQLLQPGQVVRIIQLSAGNHSQSPLLKQRRKRKRHNQKPTLTSTLYRGAAPKRHRPDLCMNVLNTLGNGSHPDSHQPPDDSPSSPSNTRKGNGFHSRSEHLSGQSSANASDVKESLLLEGATESVSSHAEDDIPQPNPHRHPHQSEPGEKRFTLSNTPRINCHLTTKNNADAENVDRFIPKRERFTNDPTHEHHRAGRNDASSHKQSPASASFCNLQAPKRKSLQSPETRRHEKNAMSRVPDTTHRNNNHAQEAYPRASTELRDYVSKGDPARRALAHTSSLPLPDRRDALLDEVDQNRIECVHDHLYLQRKRRPDAVQSQHRYDAISDLLRRGTQGTDLRSPQDYESSVEHRKSTSIDLMELPVNKQPPKHNDHRESKSNTPEKERQRRVMMSKSSFIPKGLKLRVRPKKMVKARRRRSLQLTHGNRNRLQQAPIQVGGGNIFSGWALDVAQENPITIADGEAPTTLPPNSARRKNSTSGIESTSAPLTRRRSLRLAHQRHLSQPSGSPEIIQISDSDEEQAKPDKPEKSSIDKESSDLASAALSRLSLRDEGRKLKDLPSCPYLKPLSKEEDRLVSTVFKRKNDEEVQVIPSANIVLRGVDFKRLRGERWLNDEIINAYASLINLRNDAIFKELTPEEREDIPNTYMFNTYFYTRLSSGSKNYDYEGVRRWTTRAGIDIIDKELLLFPINLGNHHWVLAGIDTKRETFFYLDSMAGRDNAGVVHALTRWFKDELKDKHIDASFKKTDLERWSTLQNRYVIRRVGVVPHHLEPRGAAKGRISGVPKQRDGGSCGVFATKMADCLSLGIKVYFNQGDIKLVRKRMALDLIRGQLPM